MRRGSTRASTCAVLGAISALLLVFTIGCFGGGDGPDSGSAHIERIGKPIELGSAKIGSLVAFRQRNDGSFVVIDKVVLPKGGYVAIYADGGGAPGQRLGVSALLMGGPSKDVRIELTKRLSSDAVVHAMLHAEDNKNRTFEFPEHDAPILSDGRVLEAAFKVMVK